MSARAPLAPDDGQGDAHPVIWQPKRSAPPERSRTTSAHVPSTSTASPPERSGSGRLLPPPHAPTSARRVVAADGTSARHRRLSGRSGFRAAGRRSGVARSRDRIPGGPRSTIRPGTGPSSGAHKWICPGKVDTRSDLRQTSDHEVISKPSRRQFTRESRAKPSAWRPRERRVSAKPRGSSTSGRSAPSLGDAAT